MSYNIEDKLVIAIASSAVLAIDAANDEFRNKGVDAYREYQRKYQGDILDKGIAFAFVKRLLQFNKFFPELQPVEVILISHNDSDTGLRIMNSLQHYNLGISRAAFITDDQPYKYLSAYNASIFLSQNLDDIEEAIANGFAAGQVLPSVINDNEQDHGLRISFDFDGVLADGSSEEIFQTQGLEEFQKNESAQALIPCNEGPLATLFKKLSALRDLEINRQKNDKNYQRILEMSIVTARSAPAHKRVVNTLREWGVTIDKTFFLGGISKGKILNVICPHIFFDDQIDPHLEVAKDYTPSVHIPLKTTKK